MSENVQVVEATGELRDQAIRLLDIELRDSARCFITASKGRVDAALATNIESPVLSTLVLPTFQPEISFEPRVARALIRSAISYLSSSTVSVVTLLSPESIEVDRQRLLEQTDFLYAGTVGFCVCQSHRFENTPKSDLDLIPMAERRDQFREILLRTSEATLDLPKMLTAWNPDQMLRHLHHVYGDSPPLWFVAERNGVAVGTLMMDADRDEARLIYLGVCPEFRGNGLGRALTKAAKHLARNSGVKALKLSVDCANSPAARIYESSGFLTYTTQNLYFQSL